YYNPKFLEFSFSETVWDQPHNFVLEIMSAMGLLGLAAYLSLIGIIFFQLIKKIKGGENSNASLAAIFLAGGVGAYVVQLLFSFETSNSLQVWFLALPLVGWLALKENREEVPVRDRYLNPAIIIYLVFLIVSFTMGVRMLKASYYTSLARDARFIDSKYLWEKNADLAISAPVPFRWEQAINLTMDLANMDGGGKLDQETFDAVAPKLETAYLDAIKKYPDTYIYKFWLGQLYSFMGEYINRDYYPKAEAVLLDAGKINEDRQQIPLLLGKLYFLWGDDKKSEEVLGKLAEKNPDYPEPHWFYGLALMKNNKTKEGIAELEKGLSYAQTSKGNLSYIIDIYAREKMFEKIVPIYERMIAGNPGDASNYARLSATYMAMGNKEKAVEYMQKAVEINPALQEEAIKFLKDNGVTVK
ncbi:MAG: tetratricopeptide repeat protein, partial [Patescibacteria group bacterium]